MDDRQFTYTTASRDETVALCGLEKLLKGGNTNLPLAASIKIQARAKGMLQRKKDRQRRADSDVMQQQQQQQPEVKTKEATPRAPPAAAIVAAPAPDPPIALDSLPKGIHPSITKLAKSVAEQRRSGDDAHKKAAAGKQALQQMQQERLAMQARAERAEEELRFFRAAESRSNSRASVGPDKLAPSSSDSLAAMGAAHERAAVAEAELAMLQSKVTKLQGDIASVRSESVDGFKARLSTALAEVSAIEREVRLQVSVTRRSAVPSLLSPVQLAAGCSTRLLLTLRRRMQRHRPSAAR